MKRPSQQSQEFGCGIVCLSRGCGALSAIILLASGFITLIPTDLIFGEVSQVARCVPAGILMIIFSVLMFMSEVPIIGTLCSERFLFLANFFNHIKHWHRMIIYVVFSVIPLALCPSVSTVIGCGVVFITGVLNFVLAIGQKGDHDGDYTLSTVRYQSEGEEDEAVILENPTIDSNV
ncbi:calcium channel flower homolog [Dysidea avara]|uniref:calcium channel flower homolog n=1 Tax=Dysidea avara TaxID=196820 RepID=UPI00333091C0